MCIVDLEQVKHGNTFDQILESNKIETLEKVHLKFIQRIDSNFHNISISIFIGESNYSACQLCVSNFFTVQKSCS